MILQSTHKVIPRVSPHWGDGFLADGARDTNTTPRCCGCLFCYLLLQFGKHVCLFTDSFWLQFPVSGKQASSLAAWSLWLLVLMTETEPRPYAVPLKTSLNWWFHSATSRKEKKQLSKLEDWHCLVPQGLVFVILKNFNHVYFQLLMHHLEIQSLAYLSMSKPQFPAKIGLLIVILTSYHHFKTVLVSISVDYVTDMKKVQDIRWKAVVFHCALSLSHSLSLKDCKQKCCYILKGCSWNENTA